MISYDLELGRVISRIEEKGHKRVMIQLPEGLKTSAKEIVDTIQEITGAEVIIWSGSCFGACDIPAGIEQLGIELYLQWGHNVFRKTEGW